MTCCGRTFSTSRKSFVFSNILLLFFSGKATVATWNEQFVWSDIDLTPQQFKSSFINFELQAAYDFSRNEVLGKVSIQCKTKILSRLFFSICSKFL